MNQIEPYQLEWNNFVEPFLSKDCKEMTFIEIGGSFSEFAKGKGFSQVISVAPEETKNIVEFSLADFTLLVDCIQSFTINDWLDYLDVLQYKTRYCIVITSQRASKQRCWTSPETSNIRNYFKGWREVKFIDGTPRVFCFQSPFIERVLIDSLDCGNHVQDQFYSQLDNGVEYKNTRYYRILSHYRKNWGVERLNKWTEERIRVWKDVKKRQLIRPIYIDKDNRILDGNHRYAMMRTLGFKTILVRRT